MTTRVYAAVVCVALAIAPMAADVWDDQVTSDDTTGTGNELMHGSDQVHDLAARPGPAPDQDYYKIAIKPYSSYEIVVDALSADFGGPGNLLLEQRGSNGTTVISAAVAASGVALNRSLRIKNSTATNTTTNFIRVGGAVCASFCGADDQYRIRMVDTTVSLARFNNSGTQLTVLFVQNASEGAVDITMHFWSSAGALLGGPFNATIPARGLQVFNTSAQAALMGQSGSVTITHNGAYGSVNAKAVSIEPATGFSFDTPGVYRAR